MIGLIDGVFWKFLFPIGSILGPIIKRILFLLFWIESLLLRTGMPIFPCPPLLPFPEWVVIILPWCWILGPEDIVDQKCSGLRNGGFPNLDLNKLLEMLGTLFPLTYLLLKT